MESAHAGAEAIKLVPTLPKDKAIIINMSGRGDKDIFITCPVFRPEEWKRFLVSELERLNDNKDIHQAKSMN
jgi:tryptophan synthase beta chain